MITRFTEVKQTQGNSVPIGTSSDYITLPDGTILTDVLGDVNLITNGSIKEQIDKIAPKKQSGYAPIEAPFFKYGAFVRRYNKENLITDLPLSSKSRNESGVIANFNENNSWTISGTLGSRTEDIILHLYGDSSSSLNLLGAGNYLITISGSENLFSNGSYLKLVFYTKSTNTYSDIRYSQIITDQPFSISQGANTDGESDQRLVGIDYIIPITIEDHTTFNYENFKITLTDPNNILEEDKYHVVFDVQQDRTDKSWTTTIAENLVVAKGLQDEPRSSLGTIYDSKWEGPLSITQTNNKKSGVLTQNSGIGFILDSKGDFSDTEFNQNASQVTTPTYYRIYSGYSSNEGTLFYDSAARHTFRILKDNTLTNVLQISPEKNLFSGTTQINGNVIVGNNYSLQVAHIEKGTTIIPRSAYIQTMAQFQRIINDSANYPDFYVIPVSFQQDVATYLSQGGNYTDSTKWGTRGVGFILKLNNHNAYVYFFANSKLYRVGYSWPAGEFQTAQGVSNRTIRIYSTNIATQQFVKVGNAATFNHTTTTT